jgi:predicted nucleotidyltransferase
VDREGIERLIQERLVNEPSAIAVWLFGSLARGTATARSDVDVAILSSSARSNGYAVVDAKIVRDILENHGADLLAFTAAIRAKLPPITEP